MTFIPMDILLMVVPLTAMLILTIGLFFTKDFLTDVIMLSFFSFFSCFFYVITDGADVAFTESAVGSGVSIIILLATLLLTDGAYKRDAQRTRLSWVWTLFATILVFFSLLLLLYGVQGMVPYGAVDGYAIGYTAPHYIATSYATYHIPNMITMVLGSFRGFDTMGETTVVFAAAVATIAILLGLKGKRHHD